ncbi:MAG TPA: histidine triad nucleotide-binding protein [Clostridia bacterium]|nr:histidine triad nucleotide-binding protein [Clostridia bacterium]
MSDCIFCKIIEGEIPSTTIYENESVKVFKDIKPVAPVHLIIVPKMHIDDTGAINDDNKAAVAECLNAVKVAAKLAGVEKSGYRVISNCGKDGGQTVNHLHFHLIGGVKMREGLI